jgi:hypothetical protein
MTAGGGSQVFRFLPMAIAAIFRPGAIDCGKFCLRQQLLVLQRAVIRDLAASRLHARCIAAEIFAPFNGSSIQVAERGSGANSDPASF